MSVLKPSDEKLLAALLCHSTVKAAADSVGLSDVSAWRRVKDPDFAEAYRQARRQTMQQVIVQMQQSASVAVDALTDICADTSAPKAARVSAARSLLEFGFRGMETDDCIFRRNRTVIRIPIRTPIRIESERRFASKTINLQPGDAGADIMTARQGLLSIRRGVFASNHL